VIGLFSFDGTKSLLKCLDNLLSFQEDISLCRVPLSPPNVLDVHLASFSLLWSTGIFIEYFFWDWVDLKRSSETSLLFISYGPLNGTIRRPGLSAYFFLWLLKLLFVVAKCFLAVPPTALLCLSFDTAGNTRKLYGPTEERDNSINRLFEYDLNK